MMGRFNIPAPVRQGLAVTIRAGGPGLGVDRVLEGQVRRVDHLRKRVASVVLPDRPEVARFSCGLAGR